MKTIRILLLAFLPILTGSADVPNATHDFRIRTITAGVTLESLDDLEAIHRAIAFLEAAKRAYTEKGYEVQTLRIASQNLHELIPGRPDGHTLEQLRAIDAILARSHISMAIGELLEGDHYDAALAGFAVALVRETENLNFSLPIASEELGIHQATIKTAAGVCAALAKSSPGGEANFRFTASANCPAGIPFFPAAFHKGKNSYAIGLEYPNLLTKVIEKSTWDNAEDNLKNELNKQFKPIEAVAQALQSPDWGYDGIDTSPAPGLDASIGRAIEALTGKPFGSPTTLSACAVITRAIKALEVKSCGYSGLMLPVIEDEVLARRAVEGRYTVEELLLFSSVSGTGLDVVPIPGDTAMDTIEGIYRDVAALSLRYYNKALSARLFPIPGKQAGEPISFENPYLTASVVMKVN